MSLYNALITRRPASDLGPLEVSHGTINSLYTHSSFLYLDDVCELPIEVVTKLQ